MTTPRRTKQTNQDIAAIAAIVAVALAIAFAIAAPPIAHPVLGATLAVIGAAVLNDCRSKQQDRNVTAEAVLGGVLLLAGILRF